MYRFMKYLAKLTALVMATSLVGCGGGGGGLFGLDLTSYGLIGFAAKGKLKYATVEVFSLDANGVQSTSPVKTAETDVDGNYNIPDVGKTAGQRYIVKITPNSRTIHVDELLGDQRLPSNFALTAVTKTETATTTASVTPFSHMMVEAAKSSSGGLNDSNIAKAQTTVTELLGFNPTTISKNDGVSIDAQKLNTMLTAVSQMSKDGVLGCTSGSGGDKTTCITQKLAAATSISSLKLETTNGSSTVNVSNYLAAAVNTTLQKPEFQAQSALVAQAINKLNCTTNCAAAAAVDSVTGNAIAKIKNVIDEIRTDLTAMFSSDGATSTSKGQINIQAFKFKQSFDGVNLQTDQAISDVSAMDIGIELYSDYKASRTSVPYMDTKYGKFAYASNYNKPAVQCSLYQTDKSINPAAPIATNASNANFVYCKAYYAQIVQGSNYVYYGHSIALSPASTGLFNYKISATKLTCPISGQCNTPAIDFLQGSNAAPISYTGTASEVSLDANGHPLSFSVNGDLPPGFQKINFGSYPITPALVRTTGKDNVRLNVQVIENLSFEITRVALSGTLSSLDGSGNKITELSLRDGTFADQIDNTVKLDLAFSSFSSTNTATLSGVLIADTPVNDKSGTKTSASHVQFTGTLSNTSGGLETDFLQGVVDVRIQNYNNFDARYTQSASNTANEILTFTGSLTAPNQPRLELIFATSGKAYNMSDTALATTLTYNRYVGSTSTRSVGLSSTRASLAAKSQATVTEATSGFSISFTDGDTTTKVYANGNEVGTLNLKSGLLTFKDGGIASLDIQL